MPGVRLRVPRSEGRVVDVSRLPGEGAVAGEMSDIAWRKAVKFTLAYEGGWVDDPRDRGGETFRGISRRFWPDWPGWKIVDEIRATYSPEVFRSMLLEDDRLTAMATVFYQDNIWRPIHGDELPDKIAVAAFDMACHSGPKTAAKVLQVALGGLTVDGDIGSRTIKRAFDCGEDGLISFLTERTVFLSRIIQEDPSQSVWARNWFKRMFRLANVVLEGEGLTFAVPVA